MSTMLDVYDFVHLSFSAVGGKIKGKTKLQKTIYFLGLMTDSVDQLGYRAHFYGPYSEDVAGAVNRLRSLGFIDQSVAGGGAVNGFGFEVCRYDYQLNEDGEAVAKRKKKKYPQLWRKMTTAAKLLEKAGDLDYMKLSIAAKIYYMLEKKTGATDTMLMNLARKLGWKVDDREVREATDYLKKLKLI